MNIPGYSTNGLKMMLEGARDALAVDDATPAGQPKFYGCREFADWRVQSDEIEAELKKRQVSFVPIPW